ncbi:hypothetical protein [Amycolatopsis minnesotensis]|uniref:hypothetical protein n=1 Tax=Amycolatopsis minnesotensis TaxID=337894 RepID=UPI0031D243E1
MLDREWGAQQGQDSGARGEHDPFAQRWQTGLHIEVMMQSPDNESRRHKHYYFVVVAMLVITIALGIVFINQAPWVLILAGVLLGGFLVTAIAEWIKQRRPSGHGPDHAP